MKILTLQTLRNQVGVSSFPEIFETIFEEGYGEIDHQLRYSHTDIPEILKSNLLLFNRIIGSVDEMASLIYTLEKDWCEKEASYKNMIEKQQQEINQLKALIK